MPVTALSLRSRAPAPSTGPAFARHALRCYRAVQAAVNAPEPIKVSPAARARVSCVAARDSAALRYGDWFVNAEAELYIVPGVPSGEVAGPQTATKASLGALYRRQGEPRVTDVESRCDLRYVPPAWRRFRAGCGYYVA